MIICTYCNQEAHYICNGSSLCTTHYHKQSTAKLMRPEDTDRIPNGIIVVTRDDQGERAISYKAMNDVSDGYHTFDELYESRLLYNAALFNDWAKHDLAYSQIGTGKLKYHVHKSWKHSDGELAFGGGWFVVVAQLPTGQITNHYQAKDWELFQVPARDQAAEWDGHTPQDVAVRLRAFLEQKRG